MSSPSRPTVFVSYSHQDEAWKDRLVQQLRVLELEGDLEVWEDCQIEAGDEWQPAIEEAMAGARAAVLLISAAFLTSRFIRGTEVPTLLWRRESNGIRVIPVIVRPCPWTVVPWLAKIQCRPKNGKALVSFTKPKADQHLADLALEIRDLLTAPSRIQTRDHQFPTPGFPTGVAQRFLHNLPYPPLGNLFAGRQEELDALAGDTIAAITQSAAISGLGGIGKTRLAVEYAWRSGYTAAWFVRADSPENLRRNLAALAGPKLLNLPEWKAQEEEETVGAVLRWLREHTGWLMILDNVDTTDAAAAVLEVLPSLLEGHTLITSRLTTWPASVRKQSLDTLPPEEAVRFLLQRTEGGREPAADDAERAADLAQRVDGLPLALEQAAAYIVRHRLRFTDYLGTWEGARQEVLRWFEPLVMQYPASVAVTWQQTFQQLSPMAAALLRLMAFLAPDPIPIDVLEQGAEHVKKAAKLLGRELEPRPLDAFLLLLSLPAFRKELETETQSVRDALAELYEYSMVSWQDGGTVTVHRMVQEAVRNQIPEERTPHWIEGALRLVNRAFPYDSDDVRTWEVGDRLRPHATKIAALADQAGIYDPTCRLMNQLGLLLLSKALYSEAEPLMRRTLAIDEASFGNEHPNVASRLNNLATLLKDTNRLGEAEPLMRRALAIDEASFGREHPSVARDLNNLAALFQATDRLELAEPLMRRALAIDKATFGNEHPNVASDLNNLATLLQDTNRPEEAEPLIRRALAIDEAALHTEHPDVARDLNNLATLLRDTNRLKEAEPLMRRAVAIWEKSLGPDHPDTQLGRENLEILLSEMGEGAGEGE